MSRLGAGLSLYVLAIALFLLAPVAIVVVAAFTDGDFVTFPPQGTSLRWFAKVLGDAQFMLPLWNSFILGLASTLVSTALAVPAAIALVRYRIPGVSFIQAFLLSPLTLPTIILAIGLLFFISHLGFLSSFPALVTGHVVITVPYTFRTVLGVYGPCRLGFG